MGVIHVRYKTVIQYFELRARTREFVIQSSIAQVSCATRGINIYL